jgi:hypothetical protein
MTEPTQKLLVLLEGALLKSSTSSNELVAEAAPAIRDALSKVRTAATLESASFIIKDVLAITDPVERIDRLCEAFDPEMSKIDLGCYVQALKDVAAADFSKYKGDELLKAVAQALVQQTVLHKFSLDFGKHYKLHKFVDSLGLHTQVGIVSKLVICGATDTEAALKYFIKGQQARKRARTTK